MIKNTYASSESNGVCQGTLVLELPELETWLISRFAELGVDIDAQSDFFAADVDSLKAIQMRGLIVRRLDLGGKGVRLPSMLIYDCGNIERLARSLYGIRKGETCEGNDEVALMREIIERYSILPGFPQRPQSHDRVVVVSLLSPHIDIV